MTHKLETLIDAVEATHKYLGELVAFECIIVKCKKLLLVVSPHGCGKSRASAFIGESTPQAKILDRLSAAGLANVEDFNHFRSVVVVDDIAKTQTTYARINTMTTLAELVYSHYIHSRMAHMSFDIEDFFGSAIVNIQPVLLKSLVTSAEWEASMEDKAVRYYHLHRPSDPRNKMPDVRIDWGGEYGKVAETDTTTEQFRQFMFENKGQWTLSRTKEHLSSFLQAAAALDGREAVNDEDYRVVNRLLKPLKYETLVMDKQNFESERHLDSNRLAILTEMVTYGHFTLSQISNDYHISEVHAYRLMENCTVDWEIIRKHPVTYSPSPELTARIKALGLNGAHPQ
jgi:hypothetical protein